MTAVELLPVHHIADEGFLHDRGLTNYWGYSTIGYLAPHSLYAATGDPVREFKGMVKALHRAGIEVILDVVYNHTAEGNHLGPMLSFRGVDNQSYYRLVPDSPRYYMDYTGTGNTLNPVHPTVLRLIMDSLRYFVLECHVDGFRFDLASALAREFYEVDRLSAFFDVIHQDPVLSQVKLIAEPWDVGPGGYQVGNFPILWSEWNGIYRDTMRDFWRGDAPLRDFASRFGGSADLYESDGRRPFASINFITAHDGFTLRDLVSFNDKHNEANGEGNRDGTDDNRSWNCGAEGATDDQGVLDLRGRQQRNFLTTLFLSQGVPMLLGGDEFGRSQGGNNNAWCQDNEISWFDWEHPDADLFGFTRRLIELRRSHPVFRRTQFLEGTGEGAAGRLVDAPDGRRMTRRDWDNTGSRAIGVFLNGDELRAETAHGEEVRDDSFLLLFNAHFEDIPFRLPARRFGTRWDRRAVDGLVPRRSASSPGRERRGREPVGRGPAPCFQGYLPPAADARLRLRAGSRARAVPARARHLASLPLAVAAGARKARSTATTSSTRATSPTRSAARSEFRALADDGARDHPRHRPEPHGGGRREPVLARPERCARCSSTSTCAPGSTGASSTSASSAA